MYSTQAFFFQQRFPLTYRSLDMEMEPVPALATVGGIFMNVLYDCPSTLRLMPGVDPGLDFKFKLTQIPDIVLKDPNLENAQKPFFDLLNDCISDNVSFGIALSIGLMGGAYTEQFNYLGRYNINERNGKVSDLRKYTHNINKRDFGVSNGDIVIRQAFSSNGINQSYLYLSDLGKELVIAPLCLNGNNKSRVSFTIENLIDTHQTNLEHACGVNDLFAYILGNTFYPSHFSMNNEYRCDFGGTFLASDALCTTYYYPSATSSSVIFKDHIEVDTGSQKCSHIQDKMINYVEYISSCEHSELPFKSIVFLNHPNGLCGMENRTMRKQRNIVADSRQVCITTNDICLLQLGSSLYSVKTVNQLYHIMTNFEDNISQLEMGSEPLYGVKAALNDTFLSRIKKLCKVGYSSFLISELIVENTRGNDGNIYSRRYDLYLGIFKARRIRILKKYIPALQIDYPDYYQKLTALCLQGLSVYCCFGGDMYRTYLTLHPQMTGAAESIGRILHRCSLTGATFNGTLTIPVNPFESITLKNGSYVVKNVIHYNADTPFAIEDITNDFGSIVRVAALINSPDFKNYNIRLVVICDDEYDAYSYLIRYCRAAFENVAETSLMPSVRFQGQTSVTPLPHLFPIFMPRSCIINEMSNDVMDQTPFVLSGISAYKEAVNYIGQNASAFSEQFDKNIRRFNINNDIEPLSFN